MEAAGLGLFMVSAGVFGTLLEYPQSGLRHAIPDPTLRRALMGLLMGLTAVCLIYSPWGQQSGAHYNPAVTLTFLRLGKVDPRDAVGYIVAQFLGGTAGVLLVSVLLREAFTQPPVSYVATVPGGAGKGIAFLAELLISFFLMLTVLFASNSPRAARYTGMFAGLLLFVYITVEAPVSGMSMNPARTFASALPDRMWTALWIYFLAPPLGMLLGNERALYLREGRLTLDGRYCWVDAWAFERLLLQAEGAEWEGAGQPSDSKFIRLAEKAIGLYMGLFLEREAAHPRVVSPRERLRSKFLRAVEDVGRRWEIAGVIWEPLITRLSDEGTARVLVDGTGIKNGILVIVATNSFVARNPDLIRKFLEVYERARDFLRENPREAARLISGEVNLPPGSPP